MRSLIKLLVFILYITTSSSYKILSIFPYNGRSHHIYFSSLVEELATKNNEVTVINYFPVKKMANLKQIQLENLNNNSDSVDIEDHLNVLKSWFKDFYFVTDSAAAFRYMANSNCEKLINNKEVQELVRSNEKFDVVIVEQFVTDCGLALARELDAPIVGVTAHILMPWTYSRLGATNNPAFVPNHFIATGSKPNLWNKLKSLLINMFFNAYYKIYIQSRDYEIVKKVYPNTPDLETLGRNISITLLNQFFPLTGSRIYGANVIEVGGLHIKKTNELSDKELQNFLDTARNGVVFISFGSVAKNLPRKVLNVIAEVIQNSNMRIVWKVDDVEIFTDLRSKNTLLRKWVVQPAILCHPNVKAFITHSGMLSSSEAMYCGVPVVSVPMFGDQFSNAEAAREIGLGVPVDLATLDVRTLRDALDTVLLERYQKRAKELSALWRERPLSPMDTAIYWIEYVAKHKQIANLRPPTVDLPLHEYLLLDVSLVIVSSIIVPLYIVWKIFRRLSKRNKLQKKTKRS